MDVRFSLHFDEMRCENTLRLSGLRQWMKSEAERPECVPIDQMWDEVRSLSLSLSLALTDRRLSLSR